MCTGLAATTISHALARNSYGVEATPADGCAQERAWKSTISLGT